jgi:uncharacterized delta-60 repeat protein
MAVFHSILALVAAALLMPDAVSAQAGALDPAFDGDGRIVTDFFGGREQAHDVVIQPDGRIIAAGFAIDPATATAGDFALSRYNVDGSLDASFGANGRVATDFFLDNDNIDAIAMQPDGKIIAVGFASRGGAVHLAMARYNTDGALDTTFGTGGTVTSTLGRGLAVTVQSDGRIVVGTWTGTSTLARFDAGGTLDATFGGGGTASVDFTVNDLTVDASGKIVAAGTGTVIVGPDPEDPGGVIGREVFAVARLNVDGSRDATFGGGATVLTDISGSSGVSSRAMAVVVQADGRIVAAGTANGFALERLLDDGTLDTTFGTGGVATAHPTGNNDQAFDVALQVDGKFVVAGWSIGRASSNDFALARFNSDGTLDRDFGEAGAVTTDFLHNTADLGSAVAIAPDGRIVVAGYTNVGDFSTDTFALARYLAAFSPRAAIQKLLDDVQALVSADALNRGQGRALSNKLERALRRLEDGNVDGAVEALNEFSEQVNDLVDNGRLNASQGRALVDQAAAIARLIRQ